MPWTQRLAALAALALLTAGAAVPVAVAQGKGEDRMPPTGELRIASGENLEAVTIADLMDTDAPEAVVVTPRGAIYVVNLSDNTIAAENRASGNTAFQTPASTGDFLGRNRLEIVVGTLDRRLQVYEGTTLRLLAETTLERELAVQPTVLPAPGQGETRDAIVVNDNTGALRMFVLDQDAASSGWKFRELWKASVGSTLTGPAVVGQLRGPGFREIVGLAATGEAIIVHVEDGQVRKHMISERRSFAYSPLVADVVRGDGDRDEIIALQRETGNLSCFRYTPEDRNALASVWANPAKVGGIPLGGPLLLGKPSDVNDRFVILMLADGITAVDPATGAIVASQKNLSVETAASIIPRRDGYPELAWGGKANITITNGILDWARGRAPVIESITVTTPDTVRGALAVATRQDGSGDRAVLVGTSASGFLRHWKTQISTDWPTRTPWESVFGNMRHAGRLDHAYAIAARERAMRRKQEIDARESALAKAREAGDWSGAVSAAEWLVNANPLKEDYRASLREARIRNNIVSLALGFLGATALIGFAGFQISVVMSRRHALRRAQQLAQRGLYDDARRVYERLLAKRPEDPRVFLPLAAVYLAQQDYSEQTLATYAKAHKATPDNRDVLHAYVRALLRRPEASAEAAAAYEAALPSFPETALLEYGLGVCAAARGDYEAAGKRFRAALRGGHQADEVYAALCDVYLKTKNTTAKALPVYQQQFPRRQNSQPFIEAYLLSCIDAKKVEPEVESLCHQVLQGNSSFLPAYFHLAAIHLQKGAIGQAVEEVRAALRHDSHNAQGIALLAHCYLVQNRRDEEALAIYRKALANAPSDRELLTVIAGILFDRGQFDAEAVDIYRRAHAENPGDTTVLRALAETALLTNDHKLAIASIEALSNLGQLNQKLVRQLAQAYIREGIMEPRAERVLREAVRIDPKNLEFLTALARVLQVQDRVDSEAIPIYESVLASSPDDTAVGGQLARAYISSARYDNALRLAERLLQRKPGDENLKRVMALASLYTNKIDEAIAEYQKILAQDPNDADALINLALAYAQKQRTDDEASRVFSRAAELSPTNELIPLAQARLAVAKNDHIRAIEFYQKALKTRPGVEDTVIGHLQAILAENPEAVRLRWFLCEMLVAFNRLREAMEQLTQIYESSPGQIKNVLSALDKILAKDAGNVLALSQKGRLLAEGGSLLPARKALEKAVSLQPNNPEIQKYLVAVYEKLLAEKEEAEVRLQLGKLWYNLGEYDRAIGCFQKTSQDYRFEAECAKALGKCFTAKGMLDLALQEYKKLVVDEETKELLYDLAQRYEAKKDFVGAKTVYRQLFAADIDYKDVRRRFEMLSGQTTDPLAFEKTSIVEQMSEQAQRRYELLEELGRGAMGIVYKAKDRELDEIVALKILPDAMSNNPEAVRRFKIEARNARRLSHPNIVRIHDIGEEMGRKYISMEIVEGSDLKKRIKGGGPLTVPEFVSYSMQIADALAYAHRLGIVHRDIKPANIMLTARGEVKITDFGIAKLMDQTGEGTMVGAVIGTPLYMSPEQVRGVPVDSRADIYSFGIMMYEFINGRPPFIEGDLAWQHINREPDRPANCHDLLWPIIAKCLAKNKEDRWDSAELIYDRLKELKPRLLQ